MGMIRLGRDKLPERAPSFRAEGFDLVKEIGQTCDRSATVADAPSPETHDSTAGFISEKGFRTPEPSADMPVWLVSRFAEQRFNA